MTKQVRQGDVLVMKGGKKTKAHKPTNDPRGAVLAEGEATGHHHRIKMAGVTLLQAEGVSDRVLTVAKDVVALLEHEEHATIPIGGGTYTVRRQKEYDYTQRQARNVAD